MAREKYRLQALLMVKQRMKKRAELQLARAIKAFLEEKKRLEELEKELEEIIETWKQARLEMKKTMSCEALVGKGNVHVNYLRKLKEDEEAKNEDIEDQHRVIEEAEARVARARRDYIDASRELKVMEEHKELWKKRVRGEINRLEMRKLDELGNTIHQLKRWRGEKSVFEV